MTASVDVRIVEFLCSRICHDVISPITAINNGVELWRDMGPEVVDDALGLIAHSADQATRKVLFLRLAYGAAGSDAGEKEAREVAAGLFEGTKVELEWPAGGGIAEALPDGGLKLVLNVLMIAGECIGTGGRITLAASGAAVTVSATGKTAALRDGVAEALAGTLPLTKLEPRTAHAAMTRHFAENLGCAVELRAAPPDRIDFRIARG